MNYDCNSAIWSNSYITYVACKLGLKGGLSKLQLWGSQIETDVEGIIDPLLVEAEKFIMNEAALIIGVSLIYVAILPGCYKAGSFPLALITTYASVSLHAILANVAYLIAGAGVLSFVISAYRSGKEIGL